MAQNWLVPVVGGDTMNTALLTKANDALEALRTLHSGGSAPSVKVAYMLYANTASKLLEMRNTADSAWVEIAALNARNHVQAPLIRVPGLAATDAFYIWVPEDPVKILGVNWLTDTATAGSGVSDRWVLQIRNLTAANDLLATAWNTDDDAELALDASNWIPTDQNQSVAARDVIEIQITKTGTPTDLTAAEIAFQATGTLVGA